MESNFQFPPVFVCNATEFRPLNLMNVRNAAKLFVLLALAAEHGLYAVANPLFNVWKQ